MKTLKLLMAILLALTLSVSCSSKKAAVEDSDGDDYVSSHSENNPESLNATVELDENGEEILASSEELDDEMATEETDLYEVQEATTAELSQDSENEDLSISESSEIAKSSEVSSMSDGQGEVDFYEVKKHDTLMMIAFKIYGDVSKWKDLMRLNEDKMKNGYPMTGQVLAYKIPTEKFIYSPQGNPYLVLGGDTLSLISYKVYDRAKYWVHIFENNRELIKNPDNIYAGFTLYTLPKEEIQDRNIASKQ
ncbi:MAG: LysM peptidoglycan-binding domain-containing protein [Bacteriovoracaceae bacterium]|jgi:nucleoid-associated protein YgaU|nr:LysM peptidoglycan-binding domain-containing protein [Bacteriovoracaceae bacterium]